MPAPTVSAPAPDALVAGGGVIGLSIALELAGRGLRCRVFTGQAQGIATPASAGLLAPSVEHTPSVAGPFLRLALELYPDYLESIGRASGIRVALQRGLIEVLPEARGEPDPAQVIRGGELAALEPALARDVAAVFHPMNGSVDSRLLWEALRAAAARHPSIQVVPESVERITPGPTAVRLATNDGIEHVGGRLVLAAGAWSATIAGLPRRLPVEPVRGQMLSFGKAALRHSVMAPTGYLVPRGDATLVGATMERVGFDHGTTPEALASLGDIARRLVPPLQDAPVAQAWAGLRPVTPDLLPIIGPDPEEPAVVYACGHSRNGILLAAITAQCVGALLVGNAPPADLNPFSPTRFEGS